MEKKIVGLYLDMDAANRLCNIIGSTLIWDKAEPLMEIVRKGKPIYEGDLPQEKPVEQKV